MRVLVVCTANICRSPAAEQLLRARLRDAGVPPGDVVVTSAGTHAVEGARRCPRSHELLTRYVEDVDDFAWSAGSTRLTADLLRDADLVLTASREVRAAAVRTLPGSQAGTFTLRQAARIASALIEEGLPTVVPLPATTDVRGRLRWLVAELDAARLPVEDPLDDDVPDPHVVGDAAHEPAMRLMVETVATFADAVTVVLTRL